MAPAVSVCIPLYQKERFVGETIRSVLAQTFTDFELVVLNNASKDGSAEVVAAFDDPRIRLEQNPETVPGPDNIERVVGLAQGSLVKIVAADDVLHPTLLAKQAAVLEDEGIALVSCRQNMVDEVGAVVYPDRSLRTLDLLGRQNRTTVLRRVCRHGSNPIGAFVNVTFRREAYEKTGGMPAAPFIALDFALWLSILGGGDFYGQPETLVDFRIADGSASASNGSAGIEELTAYVDRLRAENRELLRNSDRLYGKARTPLMTARHKLILAAAGPKDSLRTQAATRILGLSGR